MPDRLMDSKDPVGPVIFFERFGARMSSSLVVVAAVRPGMFCDARVTLSSVRNKQVLIEGKF